MEKEIKVYEDEFSPIKLTEIKTSEIETKTSKLTNEIQIDRAILQKLATALSQLYVIISAYFITS
jgi:hypothetical protein